MMRIAPSYHDELVFVQLSELPNTQVEYLKKHIPQSRWIHISVNEDQKEVCISYEDYEHCLQLLDNQNFDRYFESQI